MTYLPTKREIVGEIGGGEVLRKKLDVGEKHVGVDETTSDSSPILRTTSMYLMMVSILYPILEMRQGMHSLTC